MRSAAGGLAFPRAVRLRRSRDFDAVSAAGRKLTTRALVALVAARPGASPRFGLAVSRKVGNAVVRNRVKRWLREAIRHERDGLTGVDLVFIARPSAATTGAAGLRREVADVVARLLRRGSPA